MDDILTACDELEKQIKALDGLAVLLARDSRTEGLAINIENIKNAIERPLTIIVESAKK